VLEEVGVRSSSCSQS